jgi:ribosomal protein L6P/L9E
MSRIGRLPVPVPSGVDVRDRRPSHDRDRPPRARSRAILPPIIAIAREGDEIVVTRPGEDKLHKSLHGLTRTLVNNMVVGVTTGYRKGLEIVGVGYRAQKVGEKAPAVARLQPSDRDRAAVRHQLRAREPHAPRGRGHRQGAGRPGRRPHPRYAQARAVQGQGRALRGRAGPPQGGQGRQDRRQEVHGNEDHRTDDAGSQSAAPRDASATNASVFA